MTSISQVVDTAFEQFNSVVDVGIVYGDDKYATQYDLIVDSSADTQEWEQIVAVAQNISDTYNIFVTGATDDDACTRHFKFGQELA